ncbi:hypothetical protein WG926_22490 [Tistrella sp. BH-R2-4]|uniref:Uncharacterized protein n=1 Tax=Tistrella arctica TaxID=3133430 RepID=A0ABU9YQL8_9PROT
MKYAAIALATCVLGSSGAMAANCAQLMEAYENQGKLMSMAQAETAVDNSVYRAINTAMKVNNWQLSRQMNLTLMIQNKCPLPGDPVWLNDYSLNATECQIEMIKGNYKATECDMGKWTRIKRGN